jgi:hypothetical protein
MELRDLDILVTSYVGIAKKIHLVKPTLRHHVRIAITLPSVRCGFTVLDGGTLLTYGGELLIVSSSSAWYEIELRELFNQDRRSSINHTGGLSARCS